MPKILIVEDDVPFGTMLKTFLSKRGYEAALCFSGGDALKLIANSEFNLVLTDVRLPDYDGLEILKDVKSNNPSTQVIVMTSYAEISMAVQAMKDGAFDYVSKPFRPESILQTIENALNTEIVEQGIPKRKIASEKSKKVDDSVQYIKGVSDA